MSDLLHSSCELLLAPTSIVIDVVNQTTYNLPHFPFIEHDEMVAEISRNTSTHE